MTAQRCIRCGGKLKKKPGDPKTTAVWRCKKCGTEFVKVNRSWQPV